MPWLNLSRDFRQQLRLRLFHFLGQLGRDVVEPGEMEQPMQAIKEDFLLKLVPEFGGTVPRHGRADENLAVRKSDDIGLGRIAQEIAVDPRHGCAIDQDELEGIESFRQRPSKQRDRRLKPLQKWTNPNGCFVLLV